jgi:hypothetical protein
MVVSRRGRNVSMILRHLELRFLACLYLFRRAWSLAHGRQAGMARAIPWCASVSMARRVAPVPFARRAPRPKMRRANSPSGRKSSMKRSRPRGNDKRPPSSPPSMPGGRN